MNTAQSIDSYPNKQPGFLKKYGFEMAASFIFCLVFFIKGLSQQDGNQAGFLEFGDNLNLWCLQIINLYHQVQQGSLQGIDFLTDNGASEFFLRANLIIYSPVTLISAIFLKLSTLGAAKRFLFHLVFLHAFFSFFYCQLLARKFFYFDRWLALFFAVLYVFSVSSIIALPLLPFYLIGMLFPIALYACLAISEATPYRHLFLVSFLYILIYFSGYLPMSAAAILLTALFAGIYHLYIIPHKPYSSRFLFFVKSYSPILIATFAVLPCYLAIYLFNQHSGAPGYPLKATAHDLAILPSDMQHFVHTFFRLKKPTEEFIYWGLIPTVILAMLLFRFKKPDFPSTTAKLLSVSFSIYIFLLLISFGNHLSLSDIFYEFGVIVGKMHIYERYLIFAQLFFSIFTSIALNHLIKNKPYTIIKIFLCVSAATWILISYLLHFKLMDDHYEFEVINLLLLNIFLVALLLFNKKWILAYASLLVFFTNLSFAYNNYYPEKENYIFYNHDDALKALNFFKSNASSTDIIKYANLIPVIHTYIPRNYPWIAQSDIKLSNYYGYELGLSTEKGYTKYFPYYGQMDWDWLRKTGCEFVIYDEKAYKTYQKEIKHYGDFSKQLTLSNGNKILKLNDKFLKLPADFKKIGFNNGYIQIFYNKTAPLISDFNASAKIIKFNVTTFDTATRIVYPFWPNKKLALTINGKKTPMAPKEGLYTIDLAPGKYHIKFYYNNPLLTFGLWLMNIYYACFLLFAGIVLYKMVKKQD